MTHLSPSGAGSHAPIATDYSAAVPAENEAKDDGIPAKNVVSINRREVYRRLQPVSELLYGSATSPAFQWMKLIDQVHPTGSKSLSTLQFATVARHQSCAGWRKKFRTATPETFHEPKGDPLFIGAAVGPMIS